uniref:Uncharacterized protein n=1 Tax=Lactuca sativa TaxID=4236 RepID=A0A9R1X157_LACSA|nr:hypothetical protein LSAT_V11C800397680 [Lactuca sativa]
MTEFTSSANSVTHQGSNQPRRNLNNPNNNQQSNYRGPGSNRGRGCGLGNSNGGPRCQVYFIPGHSALNCRNWFKDAYQADDYRGGNSVTTSPYNGDPNWYIDTGATDHLTSDLDRLSVQECYNGKDQVQDANDTGLNISHIGHSKISDLGKPLVLKNV